MKSDNYNPYTDYEKYGNPLNMTHTEREKRINRIIADQETKLREDKFVWKKGEIDIVMPDEK